MALVNIGGMPNIIVGHAGRQGTVTFPSLATVTLDATNEATHAIGHFLWEDGGTHTVDTTGSSKIDLPFSTVTFANTSSTFKIGLATVDTTNGPPGRAVNSTNVITFDVEKSFTGGGGVITTGWNSHTPSSGTKTIAHGDLIAMCCQMTARAGADSILPQFASVSQAGSPYVTQYVGGSYSASIFLAPNAVITASDGTRGYFSGAPVASAITNVSFANNSSPNERGNFIQLPFPASIIGIVSNVAALADYDLVLYSDPLGTPVAQRTISVDQNTVDSTNASHRFFFFSSPYDATTNQPLAAIIKPTTTTSVQAQHATVNDSNHQNAYFPGLSGAYAVNRSSGAFAAQNSSKDRFGVGLILGAFDAGGGTLAFPPIRSN